MMLEVRDRDGRPASQKIVKLVKKMDPKDGRNFSPILNDKGHVDLSVSGDAMSIVRRLEQRGYSVKIIA
jgi:hypothetical protein